MLMCCTPQPPHASVPLTSLLAACLPPAPRPEDTAERALRNASCQHAKAAIRYVLGLRQINTNVSAALCYGLKLACGEV